MRINDCELRITNYKLRITDNRLRINDCGMRINELRMRMQELLQTKLENLILIFTSFIYQKCIIWCHSKVRISAQIEITTRYYNFG